MPDYPYAEIEQTSRLEYDITIRIGPTPENRWGPCYVGLSASPFSRLAISRRHAEWRARRLIKQYVRWQERKDTTWQVKAEG